MFNYCVVKATIDETGFHPLHRRKMFLPKDLKKGSAFHPGFCPVDTSLSLALKQSHYESNHSASPSADVHNLARKTAQGRDSSVGITTRYGRSVKVRIPVGSEIIRTLSYRSCGPPSFLYNGIGSLSRG